MQIVTFNQLKINLPQLLEKTKKGEEVIIGRAGKPIAKLVAYKSENVEDENTFGFALSEKALAVDWDKPEEDRAWKSLQ